MNLNLIKILGGYFQISEICLLNFSNCKKSSSSSGEKKCYHPEGGGGGGGLGGKTFEKQVFVKK